MVRARNPKNSAMIPRRARAGDPSLGDEPLRHRPGGTKIEGVVVSPSRPGARSAAFAWRRRPPGYRHVIAQVGRLVRMLERRRAEAPLVVGFATPGPSTPRRESSRTRTRPASTAAGSGPTWPRRWASRFDRERRQLLALAEATLGAGRGRGVVLGLILGTGCGAESSSAGRSSQGCTGSRANGGTTRSAAECALLLRAARVRRDGDLRAGPGAPLPAPHGRRARLPEIAARAASASAPPAGPCAGSTSSPRPSRRSSTSSTGCRRHRRGRATSAPLFRRHARAVLAAPLQRELRTEFLRPLLGDSAEVFGAAVLSASSRSAGGQEKVLERGGVVRLTRRTGGPLEAC